MKDLLRAFLAFLRLNRNASAHTVRAYEGDLSQFITYLAGHYQRPRPELQPSDITRPTIRGFLAELFRRGESRASAARKLAAVQVALGALSYSELDAVRHIFNQLEGEEGLLVASKIADRVGITRSVIVNALRKFESAGVIESKSLGMKGTYIRVLNDRLMNELEKLKQH